MSIPFLPGYNRPTNERSNYAKSHLFDVQNGIRTTTEMASTLADQYEFPVPDQETTLRLDRPMENFDATSAKYSTANAPLNNTSKLPAWIAYDRKVLRFYAYFKEAVYSSPVEAYRVRKCILYYYLEDDSVHIAEPKVENSGLPQGVFVKRHRVPKADNEFVNLNDLRVGATLSVYGRKFTFYDCDEFTRRFYEESGVVQPAGEEPEQDAFTKKNTVETGTFKKLMHPMKEFMEALAGKQMGVDIAATQKFLKMDGNVLRFFCLVRDDQLFGETRPLELNYFLADDTIEVLEVKETNCGRDPFPALVKRGKLPINHAECAPDLTNIGQKNNPKVQFYKLEDLRINGTINVYGRILEIKACDDFTKRFYLDNIEGFTEADFPEVEDVDTGVKTPRIKPPPYNGFGTEEDSLGSFLYLLPKVPKENFQKIVENDRLNLRFLARFSNPQAEDVNRRFVLTFHMSDDTIGVFEKFQRNSGFIGGKFNERKRFKNPKTGEWFTTFDMTSGTDVRINTFDFRIIKPDEFTKKFIVSNQHMFEPLPETFEDSES